MGGFTPMEYQCDGKASNIWTDVLFLIDSSDQITKAGFRQVVAFITAVTKHLTVGQGERQTRVGFITYGEKAELIYDLDHWRSTEELANLGRKIPYVKSSGTNIAAAIAMANKVFNSPTHRPNVPKVMVVVATGLKKGSQDPIPVATAFKDFGGIIITIANCFCPEHYMPLRVNNPEFGCFLTAKMPSMWEDAAEVCGAEHEGKLVKIENEEKAAFVMKLITQEKGAWIGLKYDGSSFVWTDGTKLGDGDFNLWPNDMKGLKGPHCVFMFRNHNLKKYYWRAGNCDEDMKYVCEVKPCSASNYCSEPVFMHRQMHRAFLQPRPPSPPNQEAQKSL
ncbi:von Willebrand factor type A domain protein [Necator americanus]|uniref:von Willebrand factor type A domain protein n=1 Tax=Necator americanus TaxID=51031 RepID=W2TW29_NECAM|nr:von Willebrand factor type A domain protein [Necator americanus]ETN86260.1 von Willebrand factor type A domain protein [Necator americanus]